MKIKILLVLIIWSISIFYASSQKSLSHIKRLYEAPDGMIYINKSLPVYLWLGNTPDKKAKRHLLKSKNTPQYSNPMYFDTEGINTVRSQYAVDPSTLKPVYPQQEVIFQIYADGLSPISKSEFLTAPKIILSKKYHYGKNLQIKINSSDAGAGVEKSFYSINGSDFELVTGLLSMEKEGEYTIKYYSVDNVGNPENIKSESFIIDMTSPETDFEIKGDKSENVLSVRSKVYLSSKDAVAGVAGIYYQIDSGAIKQYTGVINLNLLSEGEHTLTYYAIDKVKNEESPKKFVFFLDKTAPIVVEEVLGDQFFINGKAYSSSRTKLKITAVDNKAGIKSIYYSINGGKKELYEKPFYLPNSSGTVVIRTFAIDNVNNESGGRIEDSKTTATYIDLTGPNLSHFFKGSTIVVNDTIVLSPKTTILLKGEDNESGMKKITYSIDKEGETDFTAPFSISKEGSHEIAFSGFDNVNNSNVGNFIFKTDASGPEIFSKFSILPLGTYKIEGEIIEEYPDFVVIYLAATDAMVGTDKIFYSINSQTDKIYSETIKGFQKGKTYSLSIKALDRLGNEGKKELKFKIK